MKLGKILERRDMFLTEEDAPNSRKWAAMVDSSQAKQTAEGTSPRNDLQVTLTAGDIFKALEEVLGKSNLDRIIDEKANSGQNLSFPEQQQLVLEIIKEAAAHKPARSNDRGRG
ncbi:MAG: hypothetical protein KGJ06_04165 [Pseudomonadota bacterium]|nr:hypothetical protein [Pseudomonadota bacterium]